MDEHWIPARGWEGFYEVSSQGRVRSVDRYIKVRGRSKPIFRKGKVLNLNGISKNGYHFVNLRNPKSQEYTHRLVCLSFNGESPEGKTMVRHLNGNPEDNRPSNLAWGTRSENAQDSIEHGTNANSRKTHCKNGHEFTEENTAWSERGRRCRECSRLATLERSRNRVKNPPVLSKDDPRHGTTNGYSNLQCRCDLCRAAVAEYYRDLRRRKKESE